MFDISIIICSYNMRRELSRTLYSLTEPYQKNLCDFKIEIINVDTGDLLSVEQNYQNKNFEVIHFNRKKLSPVEAINFAVSKARGRFIGVWIDGARIASPQLLRFAADALFADENATVGTLSFHLGDEPQNISVLKGYNQKIEDNLLESIGWQNNGYQLFRISSYDPSSRFGIFALPCESNAFFMSKRNWDLIGGFNERFQSRGGGLANLEIWQRIAYSGRPIYMLVGEGTFHQFHGGVSTNALNDPWNEFESEYTEITGKRYVAPKLRPILIGRAHRYLDDFIKRNPTLNIGIIESLGIDG